MNEESLILLPFIHFIFSLFLSIKIFPLLLYFKRFKFFNDLPNIRKQHKEPILSIGGVGMILIYFLISLISIIFLEVENHTRYLILTGGLTYFFSIGFIDDIKKISPFIRLFLQFLGSLIFWSLGLRIYNIDISWLNLSIENIYLSDSVSLIFTIFCIMGSINCINWIDGLDGLAAGNIFISSLGLTILFYLNKDIEGLNYTAIIMGICLGFLKNNFFPAKLIMGDGGSYFLGFYLIYLVIICSNPILFDKDFISSYQNSSNIFLPIIMISLPIIDAISVIFNRIKEKKSLFYPDRSHLHHKLIDLGLDHKNVVIVMYCLAQWVVSFALLFTDFTFKYLTFLISCTILIYALRKINFLKNKIKNPY